MLSRYCQQSSYIKMDIVETTSRKFREKQKHFFDLADQGVKVIIKRGNKQAYVLTPVDEDNVYFIPAMVQRIKESQEQIRQGLSTTVQNKTELDTFFKNL